MKHLTRLVLFVLPWPFAAASQTVVNSTGNSLRHSLMTVDYSLGEIAITTLSSANNEVTQGLLQPITLKDCRFFHLIPSAFTPNHDQKNDCFGLGSIHAPASFELSVYNRWGQVVFKTSNATDCWNGDLNGQPQPTGVYVYLVKAVTDSCGAITTKGTVLLIR